MSDLLGSILNSMQKPPKVGAAAKEKLLEKKQLEKLRKIQEEEKAKLLKFRKNVEERIDKFVQSDSPKLEFETMEKVLRSIVHDVAEIAGLPAFSFGLEDVDRHVVVYKIETVPSDEELAALRRGEEYDPEKAKLKKQMETGKTAAQIATPNKQFGFVPSSNKRDQRSIEQTLADIREKKRQKTQNISNE
ncbi:Sperm-associated antigen 7-like protein [Dinothrombium tinctorium]|uniref:Sperm-associated antigen 7-like protein n=1 Tax=Dinothrombium tinctorium TaxID=1965070 RepID=A0A3S3QK99_9ACAR|nr:Sperm-associated antigen 7-like protein [Dinothrombium tinctorium]RWS10078.1 Sperm-associated antigen 7-like protein [Dinothrombium tinctorium]